MNNHSTKNEDVRINNNLIDLKVEKLVKEANSEYLYANNYTKALKIINKALKSQPDLFKALLLKGDILLALGKTEESINCLKIAVEQKPFSAKAHNSLACAYDIAGKVQEAINHTNSAFKHLTSKDKEELLLPLYDQKMSLLIRLKYFREARHTLNESLGCLLEEDSGYLFSCYENVTKSTNYRLINVDFQKAISSM